MVAPMGPLEAGERVGAKQDGGKAPDGLKDKKTDRGPQKMSMVGVSKWRGDGGERGRVQKGGPVPADCGRLW